MTLKLLCIIIFFVVMITFTDTSAGRVFAEERKDTQIEIFAIPKSGKGPMWVYLEPQVNNLKKPLKYRWYFGDGQESTDATPKPHYYEFGKYNLVLEVTAGDGKLYTAGISIDAALPG
ncbi:MAG: PKD domain-containing protein [Nitrospirae bacterium]|nr:MAG: PKD domain-containing protein [Nitrospirota bacterium]